MSRYIVENMQSLRCIYYIGSNRCEAQGEFRITDTEKREVLTERYCDKHVQIVIKDLEKKAK